jgi:hypothetical protein
MYLNESWPEEYHSETLLLDPESQTGLFVRPAPGRVLLMVRVRGEMTGSRRGEGEEGGRASKVVDNCLHASAFLSAVIFLPRASEQDQDVPHRISAPSKAAEGRPRYSLVWKLVFFPKHGQPAQSPSSPSRSSSPAGSASEGSCREGEEVQRAEYLGPSLCRPEWGPPMRFGSARPGLGRPAWKQP